MRLGPLSFRSSPAMCLGLGSLVTTWEVLPGKNWSGRRGGREGEAQAKHVIKQSPRERDLGSVLQGIFWPQGKPHLSWDGGLSLEGVSSHARPFSTWGRSRRSSEPGGSP